MGDRASARRDLAVSIGITVLAVALLLGGVELVMRMERPFAFSDEPQAFQADLGVTYAPGAVVRRTNSQDFWVEQKANSLGFLAPEPRTLESAAQSCRVALIGDSMVDGREVVPDEKMPTRLAALGASFVQGRDVAVNAYSFTGTGQLNQLPFYDRHARSFHPHVVVLVFVRNDFANNSALLEGIRYGFDPDYPPRPFARRAPDGSMETVPPDGAWRDHVLFAGREQGLVQRGHLWLTLHSYLYNWVFGRLVGVAPDLAAQLYGYDQARANVQRRDALAARPAYAGTLDGFSGRLGPDASPFAAFAAVDEPFAWERLPPAFEDAVAYTDYAIGAFAERTRADGARLVILSAENMRMFDPPGDRRFQRMKRAADAHGVPVIDLYDFIQSQGRNPAEASFAGDMHWNAKGHRWAAEAVLSYLHARPEACGAPIRSAEADQDEAAAWASPSGAR